MATPAFLLNRYQRTLGNKPRLLQRRLSIEKDMSDKKHAADIAYTNQVIKAGGGLIEGGTEFMMAKKGGYEGGMKGFLKEKAIEKFGHGGNKTYTMNKDGTMSPSTGGGVIDPKDSYRSYMEAGRKQVGVDIKKGWDNIKGLMPTKDSFSKMFEKSSEVSTPTWLHDKITGAGKHAKDQTSHSASGGYYGGKVESLQPSYLQGIIENRARDKEPGYSQSGQPLPTQEDQRNIIKAEKQRRAILEAFKEKPNRSTRYDGSSGNTSSQKLSDFNISPIETYYPDYSKYGVKFDEEFNYDLYKPRVKFESWKDIWQGKEVGK